MDKSLSNIPLPSKTRTNRQSLLDIPLPGLGLPPAPVPLNIPLPAMPHTSLNKASLPPFEPPPPLPPPVPEEMSMSPPPLPPLPLEELSQIKEGDNLADSGSLSDGEIRSDPEDNDTHDEVPVTQGDVNVRVEDMVMTDSSGEITDDDEVKEMDKMEEGGQVEEETWDDSNGSDDYDYNAANWYKYLEEDHRRPSAIQRHISTPFENQYDPDGPVIDYHVPWMMRQTKYDPQPYYRPIAILDDAYYMYDWDFGEPFHENSYGDELDPVKQNNRSVVVKKEPEVKRTPSGSSRKLDVSNSDDDSDSDEERPVKQITRRAKHDMGPLQTIKTLSCAGKVLGWMQCLFCGRVFLEPMAFDNHVKRIHGKNSTSSKQVCKKRAYSCGLSWKCEVCMIHEGTSKLFLVHIKSAFHEVNLSKWACWEKELYPAGQLSPPKPTPKLSLRVNEHAKFPDWMMKCDLCMRYADAKEYIGHLVPSGGNDNKFLKSYQFEQHLFKYHDGEDNVFSNELIRTILYLINMSKAMENPTGNVGVAGFTGAMKRGAAAAATTVSTQNAVSTWNPLAALDQSASAAFVQAGIMIPGYETAAYVPQQNMAQSLTQLGFVPNAHTVIPPALEGSSNQWYDQGSNPSDQKRRRVWGESSASQSVTRNSQFQDSFEQEEEVSPVTYVDESGKQVIDYSRCSGTYEEETAKVPDFNDLATILATVNQQAARKQQIRAAGMTSLLKTLYSNKSEAAPAAVKAGSNVSVFDTMQSTIHKILRDDKQKPETKELKPKGGSIRLAIIKITNTIYGDEFQEDSEMQNSLIERVVKDFVAVKSTSSSVSDDSGRGTDILDPQTRASEEEKAQLSVLIRRHVEELRLIQQAKKMANSVLTSDSEEEETKEEPPLPEDGPMSKKKFLLIAYGVILDSLAPGSINTELDNRIAADIILQLSHHMSNLMDSSSGYGGNTIGLQEKYMTVGLLKARYPVPHPLMNALECAVCVSLDVIRELCKLDQDSLNRLPSILRQQEGLAMTAFQDVSVLQDIISSHFV